MSLWWFTIFIRVLKDGLENNIFTNIYGLMALYGSIFGFLISFRWGGSKSLMGRMFLAFSSGLFSQFLGQIFYIYYIYVLHIEVPYPSIGDLFFTLSVIFYIVGAIYLGRIVGAHFNMQSLKGKLRALLIPLMVLALSYWIFLKDIDYDWSKPLSVFFDFIYPFGQALYISIALVAYLFSRNMLGGIMKTPILLLIASLFTQYLGDFFFTYLTYKEAWYVGGIDDYLFFLSYSFMTFSILLSGEVLNREKNAVVKE